MTQLRSMRMALGITTYEMADLIEVSQSSISKAERDLSCKNVADKETEFITKVFGVLDANEQIEVLQIAQSLIKRDIVKDRISASISEVICRTLDECASKVGLA